MSVKLFFATLGVSCSLFIVLLSHANYSQQRELQIKTLTKLTGLPGIALSTGHLENRLIYYKDYSNRLYPQMKNHSKMDYVYAK